MPNELAIVVWRPNTGRRVAARLPLRSITAPAEGLDCAVIADPAAPRRTEEVERALEGTAAGMGPVVGREEAHHSFRRAAAALALAEERSTDGLLRADDHRLALLLRSDPVLLDEIAGDRLAPLEQETALSRARLESTLLAWLRHDGNVSATASDLHVHAQTVRYRLARLRELFGEALEDSETRLELELALRSRHPAPSSQLRQAAERSTVSARS